MLRYSADLFCFVLAAVPLMGGPLHAADITFANTVLRVRRDGLPSVMHGGSALASNIYLTTWNAAYKATTGGHEWKLSEWIEAYPEIETDPNSGQWRVVCCPFATRATKRASRHRRGACPWQRASLRAMCP